MEHDEFFTNDHPQSAVQGSGNALIGDFAPFSGKVVKFIVGRNSKWVVLDVKQELSLNKWLSLTLYFSSDIENGRHPFVKDGKVSHMIYSINEKVGGGHSFEPYSALHGTGYVDVDFDITNGTFEGGFELLFEGSTSPTRKDHGGFRGVSGLEYETNPDGDQL
ncbi:hypothetical protein [Pseudomonas sp. NPDC087804]|jgi:hypothetical protein|uniref:hypothetical protein n=1 Tax=Pseudomonas sp. NPDC087804 TaxID=3364449 RepID=UPI00382794A6